MGETSETSKQSASFRTTQWTQVLQACEGGDGAIAQRALTNLCLKYWYPLYAYVRRRGKQPADAEDLAQGFLSQLLEKNRLAGVHPSKGKFRTFLLTCFDNYLCDQHDHECAKKRGGGQTILSLDWESAETRYAY
jgi:DNA-directed RNA polymerase specialized sigma24 family protein